MAKRGRFAETLCGNRAKILRGNEQLPQEIIMTNGTYCQRQREKAWIWANSTLTKDGSNWKTEKGHKTRPTLMVDAGQLLTDTVTPRGYCEHETNVTNNDTGDGNRGCR